MAGLPIAIPLPGESAVASYDWTDIAAGTGFNTFYFTNMPTDAQNLFMLIDRVIPTGENGIAAVAGTTDFDLTPFNTPKIVRGTAVFAGYIDYASANCSVTIRVYKYSGAVETAISDSCGTKTVTADNYVCVKIPLTTTNFKIGDILRVKLTFNGATGKLYVDPAGENYGARIFVPFKIDL